MISSIAAVAKNNVIGKKNDLPWYIPRDLKHFSDLTTDHKVIMGTNTYKSIVDRIGKPLPNRTNIVIASEDLDAPGCIVVRSIPEAFKKVESPEEAFVIGGAQIYKQTIDLVDRLYITHVDADIDGDVFFPEIKSTEWNLIGEERYSKDERNPYDITFAIYERKK